MENNISVEQAFLKVDVMQCSYIKWRSLTLNDRIEIVKDIKDNLHKNINLYAEAITADMNKPISQSIAEVEKCVLLCDYYIDNVADFLEPQSIKTKWNQSYVAFEPLGVLLGVMPWNFPFWQVFRFVIPSLLLGNTFVLKHASNVPKSARLLEDVFNSKKIDFPIYQNLFLKSNDIESIIAHKNIKAVSLTGSENAGRSVAEISGKYLKKCVLELGGSNAYIVLEDADLNLAVKTAVNARMQNAGQSCIAAKRFIIHASIYDRFIEAYSLALDNLKFGDKFDNSVTFGAMAREDLAEEIESQVDASIQMGAVLVKGGNRNGSFYEPTIIKDVTLEMPVFKDEVFGPVAAICSFVNFEDAVEMSNSSSFGLGVSIFTENVEYIKSKVDLFEEGAVFINEMIISDPNMPFGGLKNSGYGRELSHFALYEFANIKSVVVK